LISNKVYRWIIILLLVLPQLTFVKATSEVRSVIFSELAWAGSSISTADEWLELYNPTEELIDLSGWKISTNPLDQEMVALEFGQIAPGGHFLISNNRPDHSFSAGQSVLDILPDYTDSNLSLSNSQLELYLIDYNGQIVDKVGNGGKPFAGNSELPVSMERILTKIGEGDQQDSWQSSTQQSNFDPELPDLGTPENAGAPIIESIWCDIILDDEIDPEIKITVFDSDGLKDLAQLQLNFASQEHIIDKFPNSDISFQLDSVPKSGKFELTANLTDKSGLFANHITECRIMQSQYPPIITEALAAPPTKSPEFVEFYNPFDFEINLYGWQLDDVIDKGSKPITVNSQFVIFSKDYRVFELPSNFKLNNAGDELNLFNPLKELVTQIKLPKSKIGASLNRGKVWYLQAPTPGAKNLEPTKVVPHIKRYERKTLPELAEGNCPYHKPFLITATVAIEQGKYHQRRIIITDSDHNFELQLPKNYHTDLISGSVIEFIAKKSRAKTPRLLLHEHDIKLLGHNKYQINLDDVSEPRILSFVTFEGIANKENRRTIVKTAKHSPIITKRKGISFPNLKIGDKVSATGLIIALDPLKIRILTQEEFSILSSANIETKTQLPDETPALELLTTTSTPASTKLNLLPYQLRLKESAKSLELIRARVAGVTTSIDSKSGSNPTLSRILFLVIVLCFGLITLILGDSLWQYLKLKQKTWPN
jgi:hypothetical protein